VAFVNRSKKSTSRSRDSKARAESAPRAFGRPSRFETAFFEELTAEQVRTGKALYDGMCQELASVSLGCEILRQKLAGKASREPQELHDIAKLVNRAMIQARDTARLLQPVKPQADGLVHSLLGLAQNVSARDATTCSFECKGMILLHDDIIATFLYRIAEQAVKVAVAEYGAQNLIIELRLSRGRLVLNVSHDHHSRTECRTFDAIDAFGMRHLARIIGASLSAVPAEAGWMSITCALPNRTRDGLLLAEIEDYHAPNHSR
jgi:two-component system sensor kinase FixL